MWIRRVISFFGRALLCSYFAWLGTRYLLHFDETIGRFVENGVPQPQWAVVVSIVFLVVGSLFVLSGFAFRMGAFLLLLYVGGHVFFKFTFWSLPTDERLPVMMSGLPMVALGGALVTLLATGNGDSPVATERSDSNYEEFDR